MKGALTGSDSGGEFFVYSDAQYEQELDTLIPLIKHIDSQIERPQGGDPKISAFMVALAYKIYDPEEYVFRHLLIDTLLDPKAPGYSEHNHSVTKLLRAVQKPLLAHRDEWQFPENFDDPNAWNQAIDWILSDDMLTADFTYDLFMRRNQANIDRRYASVPIITGLYREFDGRFGDRPLRIIDLCSSLGAGSDRLEQGRPFDVSVLRRNSHGKLVPDTARAELIGRLACDYEVEESTRVDIVDFSDPSARPWAASNSGYPGEHADRKLYEAMAGTRPVRGRRPVSKVKVADVLSMRSLLDAGLEPESYDAAIISSAIYELPAGKRSLVWQNALRLLNKDGLVIANEFAYLDAAGRYRIHKEFFDEDYKYGATVLDKANLQKGKQEFLRYRNGRATELELKAGALALIRRGRGRQLAAAA